MLNSLTCVGRFFLFFSFLFVSAGIGHPLNTLQSIQKKGYLSVAMIQKSDSPFAVRDKNGNDFGIDVDLANQLAQNLGVRLRLIKTAKTYDEVIDQVAQGVADLGISNLSITLERAKKVNYSKEYFAINKAILLNQKTFSKLKKRDDDSLKTFFRGNKMGVVKGSSYLEFAEAEFPDTDIVLYESWPRLVQDLDAGVIAGVFSDQFEMEKILFFHEHGLFRYQAIILKTPQDKVAIAVSKELPDLLTWINTFLDLTLKRWTVKDLMKIYKQSRDLSEESK